MLISAKDDKDITKLMGRLGAMIIPHNQAHNNAIITRLRHRQSLRDAHDALSAGLAHDFIRRQNWRRKIFGKSPRRLAELLVMLMLKNCWGRFFKLLYWKIAENAS